MALFKYKVIDKAGKTLSGVTEAEDQHAVVAKLQQMGYYIISIQETRETRERTSPSINPLQIFIRWFVNPIFAGATIRDLAVFYRQFATMIKSGMTLAQAMNSLQSQGGNRRLRKIAAETVEYIHGGGSLSDAFARYPWMFSELHISLLRAGESGGTLETMLERIADYLDREHQVRQKLRLATLYPKILILAVIFIPALPTLVLNGFKPYMRATVGVLLPVLLVLLALWVVYRLLYQIPAFRYSVDCIKLAIPKIGKTVRMLALAKFYRVLAAMYAAGAPMSKGMAQAADASGNWFLATRLKKVIPLVEQGRSFRESIGSANVLPQMALDMLATGEQTGSIDEMLDKAAEYTENEAEVATIQATVVLGVVMLLGIALYIGSIVIKFWAGFYQGLSNYQ